jgi:hypothetical protein
MSKMLVIWEKCAGSLTRYSVNLSYVSLCRGAALQGLSCRILRYILHTTQRSSFCIYQGYSWAIFYYIFLVRFSSFKVCYLALKCVLLLDNYMYALMPTPTSGKLLFFPSVWHFGQTTFPSLNSAWLVVILNIYKQDASTFQVIH